MIIDNQNLFSDAQAVTAQAVSTFAIDTSPYFSGNTGRNLGIGKPLYVFVTLDVGMTDSGSDSTIAVELVTDDTAAMSSPVSLATLFTIPALSVAGAKFFAALPLSAAYEKFIALRFSPANGNLSTGSFTAGLTLSVDQFTPTAPGFTTGVE